MKVKIKLIYEWEEDVTDLWTQYNDDTHTLDTLKEEVICFNHGINCLDCAADNHINHDYKRDLKVEWED